MPTLFVVCTYVIDRPVALRMRRNMLSTSLAGQTIKVRLVTFATFLQTSPECGRHQSDCRAFNYYIALTY